MDAVLMVTNVVTTFAKLVRKQSGQALQRLGSKSSSVGLRSEKGTGTKVPKEKVATRETVAIVRVLLLLQVVARKFAAITQLAMDIVDLVIIANFFTHRRQMV
jgi:hypothetical protein